MSSNQQADTPTPGVTSKATERKRRQRERDKTLLYSREDWRLFLDPATLPQKAGCHPEHLRKVVLKELVDNELDATGQAALRWDQEEKCGRFLAMATGRRYPRSQNCSASTGHCCRAS